MATISYVIYFIEESQSSLTARIVGSEYLFAQKSVRSNRGGKKNYATMGYHFICYLFYREATVITVGENCQQGMSFRAKTSEIMEGN